MFNTYKCLETGNIKRAVKLTKDVISKYKGKSFYMLIKDLESFIKDTKEGNMWFNLFITDKELNFYLVEFNNSFTLLNEDTFEENYSYKNKI